MKDLQKSRALQACRMLIDMYDEAAERGPVYDLPLEQLDATVNIARLAVVKNGLKVGNRKQEAHR